METRPRYTIVNWTNHYRIVNGQVRRDAIARRSDGQLRVVSYPDGLSA